MSDEAVRDRVCQMSERMKVVYTQMDYWSFLTSPPSYAANLGVLTPHIVVAFNSGMGTDERSWHESLSKFLDLYPDTPLLLTASDMAAAKEDVKFIKSLGGDVLIENSRNPFASNLKETRVRNRNRIIRSNAILSVVVGRDGD